MFGIGLTRQRQSIQRTENTQAIYGTRQRIPPEEIESHPEGRPPCRPPKPGRTATPSGPDSARPSEMRVSRRDDRRVVRRSLAELRRQPDATARVPPKGNRGH